MLVRLRQSRVRASIQVRFPRLRRWLHQRAAEHLLREVSQAPYRIVHDPLRFSPGVALSMRDAPDGVASGAIALARVALHACPRCLWTLETRRDPTSTPRSLHLICPSCHWNLQDLIETLHAQNLITEDLILDPHTLLAPRPWTQRALRGLYRSASVVAASMSLLLRTILETLPWFTILLAALAVLYATYHVAQLYLPTY